MVGRTKEVAAQQINQSLQRLQTNHVDLLQLHEVIRLEDPDRIFFQFDTVQVPLNVMDAHFRSFQHLVLPNACTTR